MSEWPPGSDALDNAVLAATVDGGPEPLLERDRAGFKRGVESMSAGRERSARHVLAYAVRRTAMFVGADEAVAELLRAADAADADHASILRQTLLGVLDQTGAYALTAR